MPDNTQVDLTQTVEALRRELDTRTAERDEALARETAMAEVLQAINSSPGDLSLVFDAMLEKALQLCGSAFGILNVFKERNVQGVAMRGVPPAFAEVLAGNPAGLGPGTAPARILAGENFVHNLDLMEEEAYRSGDPTRAEIDEIVGMLTSNLEKIGEHGVAPTAL